MDGTILGKKYGIIEGEGGGKLTPATSDTLGGIKIGTGLSVTEDGTTSVNFPPAPEPYVLPTATDETLGGVKVGEGLSIEDGVLSADAIPAVYATTETEVGEYKGKKLYRRLFRFTANEGGNRNLDTSAIYDNAFLEWGFCEFPNGSENWKFPLPYFAPGTYNVYLAVVPFVQDHKLRLNVTVANAGEVINRAVELCILYTKYSA